MLKILKSGFILGTLLTALLLAAGCSTDETKESLKAAGEKAFLNQNYPEAREYLLKVLDKAPSDKETLHMLALAYRRDFMYDSAFFYLGKSNVLHPHDRETNAQILEVAIGLEEWEAAISAVTVMANTGDGLEMHYSRLSDLWGKADSPINALFWGRKALAARPESPELYSWVAYMAQLCDSLEVGLSILDSAITRFDSTDVFYARKANIVSLKGDHKQAEKLMRPVAQKFPNRIEFQFDLALILSRQDDPDKKQEAITMLRELAPQAPPQFNIDTIIAVLESEL